MTTIPIIVPITNTQVRDCIIGAGKKYCETSSATPQDIGFILLFIFAYIIYAGFCMWFFIEKRDNFGLALLFSIALPLLIGGLILIL